MVDPMSRAIVPEYGTGTSRFEDRCVRNRVREITGFPCLSWKLIDVLRGEQSWNPSRNGIDIVRRRDRPIRWQYASQRGKT